MIDLGYTTFTATPHVMCDLFGNTREGIIERRDDFVSSMQKKGLELSITAAAEYLVDEQLEQLLRDNIPLLTIQDNRVLIEVSFVEPPHRLHDVIFELFVKGYEPVFAHPERYSFYFRDRSALKRLKDMGCLMQCNLLSFGGYYGKSVKEFAQWIAEQGWVNMLGTDLHHQRHLEGLQKLTFSKGLQRALATVSQ
jgi:tyrosine-protein phosphatase YwqE